MPSLPSEADGFPCRKRLKDLRIRQAIFVAKRLLVTSLGAVFLAPAPGGSETRAMIELQQHLEQLTQGQENVRTTIAANYAAEKTLIELSLESINKLDGQIGSLQDSLQGMQAISSSQEEGISNRLERISEDLEQTLARIGTFNQQADDIQNTLRGIGPHLDNTASRSKAGSSPVRLRTRATH